MHKRITLHGLALLGMLAGTNAVAETQPGFYAGAGFGKANIAIDDAGFDADDSAFKIFGGYNFSQYFAVEAAYFDAGKPDERIGNGVVEVSTDGLNVSALGRLPLGEVFSLFAKLGIADYSVDVKARVRNSTLFSESGTDEDVSYGFGGAFNIGSSFELRAEYEAIAISGGDFTVLSVNGLFKF